MKYSLMSMMAVAWEVFATDYFVVHSIDELGKMPSAAAGRQKSISINDVATVDLMPGDRLLFKREERYTGDLYIRSSGTARQPIEIRAYGVGTKPVIEGYITITHAKNVHISNLTIIPPLQLAKTMSAASRAAIDATDADSTVISDITTTNTIRLLHSSYCTVERCTVTIANNQSFGIIVGFWWGPSDTTTMEAPHHLVIRDNVISGAVWAGIEAYGQNYLNRLHHLSIYGNRVSKCGCGIYLHYCRESDVYENMCRDDTLYVTSRQDKGEGYGLGLQTSSRNFIHHNYFENNRTSAMEIWGGEPASGPKNTYGPSDSNEIYGNTFYRNGRLNAQSQTGGGKYGIYLTGFATHQDIHHNLFISNEGAGVLVTTQTDARINNNTFIDDHVQFLATARRIEVKNNIFASGSRLLGYPDSNQNVMSHNLFDVADNDRMGSSNRRVTDPLFVNSAAMDYHLQSISPAIDAGCVVGYPADCESHPIDDAPDIGAYEYQHPTKVRWDHIYFIKAFQGQKKDNISVYYTLAGRKINRTGHVVMMSKMRRIIHLIEGK